MKQYPYTQRVSISKQLIATKHIMKKREGKKKKSPLLLSNNLSEPILIHLRFNLLLRSPNQSRSLLHINVLLILLIILIGILVLILTPFESRRNITSLLLTLRLVVLPHLLDRTEIALRHQPPHLHNLRRNRHRTLIVNHHIKLIIHNLDQHILKILCIRLGSIIQHIGDRTAEPIALIR
ncbi:unnamed protein product [Aspergillus oryzae RIB40]|uniref:DNA, SC003 n=2 Tax=Aspergillus oryzae TaxID=5062 RepID=Q2ULS8_ASPOR|nr:unnamed protein product [Aspergillus oryzae RIB40]EIT73288.1 hypothetical protein Ao3042_10677 [Aspergillus oryzae 3.042]KDE78309.1 hypothetical protein AO1008_04476 [Aspergillus oryzae 100-8]BAE57487.1 unnamed protein product [Aspergillus oryzae RIB40]|eukprot:EIT73288.1 hypothetical protein Ao3042_10677 [Aspergillus oryzae 3.042]